MHTIYTKSHIIHTHETLLHVSAINHHPLRDIIQRNIQPIHTAYIHNVKNRMLQINSESQKDKNVGDTEVMLVYS
jgi:hypothetical protein